MENIHPEATRILTEAGLQVDARPTALEGDELIEALDGVAVLGIRSRTQVTAQVLERVPDTLQVIGAFSIGTNQINLEKAASQGIACFNAPYSNTRSVVELVMAEIVSLARRLSEKNRNMHAGVWNKSASGSHEVRGRSLGIVGYGNIGSQLSVLAEAFGMQVMYYDIADKLALGNARRCDSLDELLASAETVTLHVDGRRENRMLFGPEQFAKMRDRALFLNLCRGFVVDEHALAENIKSGRIAGAAIDVFNTEPKSPSDPFVSELQGLDNVILTPHIGGSTQEAQFDIGRFVSGKLIDYLSTGNTMMSVNLPQVHTPAQIGHRVLHIHKNVPGVLADLNRVLSQHNANIAFQTLSTNETVGYVVTDVTDGLPALASGMSAVANTIRVRVLD